MKKIIAMLLCVLLLCGCSVPAAENTPTDPVITYDWMSGASPVSAHRTGLFLQGIAQTQNGFECTNSGAYFMRNGFLLYCDHDSDQLIKLCGRPDCTHSDYTCNARFALATNICYYDGYLYTIQNAKLIRINTDGSERVTILDASEANKDAVHGNYFSPQIWNGIFTIGLEMLDADGRTYYNYYYYKLDGSMETMELATDMSLPYQNDGDVFVTQGASALSEDGVSMYRWNPETGIQSYMTEYDGLGYYGDEEAYYMRDGVIYCLTYSTSVESAMVDTGLKGSHFVHCFPECVVVSLIPSDEQQKAGETLEKQVLFIYNWDFELIDQVELTYQGAELAYNPICGDTPQRIILMDGLANMPRYYIDKANFGTGNIQIIELDVQKGIIDEDLYLEPWEE